MFTPSVRYYFKELSVILYEEDYFGFFENALQYADKLFTEIENNLPNKHKKIAPKYFDRYGKENS